MNTKYTPKVFSREEPCTKIDLFNCFFKLGKYVDRMVIEAHAEIGLNAKKYLFREGYAALTTERGVEYYRLTQDGREWLSKGVLRYLELHPERALDCVESPPGYGKRTLKTMAKNPVKQVQKTTKFIHRRVR